MLMDVGCWWARKRILSTESVKAFPWHTGLMGDKRLPELISFLKDLHHDTWKTTHFKGLGLGTLSVQWLGTLSTSFTLNSAKCAYALTNSCISFCMAASQCTGEPWTDSTGYRIARGDQSCGDDLGTGLRRHWTRDLFPVGVPWSIDFEARWLAAKRGRGYP